MVAWRHPAISAHHSHVSWAYGELNRKPSGSGRMPSPHQFGTRLTRFADPSRAPPKATNGHGRLGAPPKNEWLRLAPPPRPSGRGRVVPPRYFGTPLTGVAAPYGELNRKPSSSGRMPSTPPFRHTSHTFRGLIESTTEGHRWPRSLGGSTEGTSGCA